MSYYKKHAKEYIEQTINCDMSEQYRFFEKQLKNKGTILDIGFGSGRDSLYFKSKGYDVYSIDPEGEFVKHAKELGLENVFQMRVEDMEYGDMFDGIWACASLLHVSSKDLNDVFKKCARALKNNGVMYVSFKHGNFEGDRDGRHYLDVDEESIKEYIKNSNLQITDILLSSDTRQTNNTKWINVMLLKHNEIQKRFLLDL